MPNHAAWLGEPLPFGQYLPEEMHMAIIMHMDLQTLLAFSQTCRGACALANQEEPWQALSQKRGLPERDVDRTSAAGVCAAKTNFAKL